MITKMLLQRCDSLRVTNKFKSTPNVLWEDILSFWVYYTDRIKIEKEGGMLEIQEWRIENMGKNGDILNHNKGIIE